MRQQLRRLCIVLLFLLVGALQAMPQEPAAVPAQTPVVPRLVKFSGALKDSAGKPFSGVVGVTFSIYKDQEGGAALWMETQNVQLDEQGHYTVPLGATKNEGLPVELFNAAESRWLGVEAPGSEALPRVLLVSVPYALKAADAETLGGMPASAFQLTQPQTPLGTAGSATSGAGASVPAPKGTASKQATIKRSAAAPAASVGTTNVVAKWLDNAGTLGNSQMTDDGTNVNMTGNAGALAYTFTGNATPPINATATIFNQAFVGPVFSGLSFRVRTGSPPADALTVDLNRNVGIGTTGPTAKLDVRGTTTAVNTAIVAATQGGSTTTAISPTTVPPVAVGGIATATTGFAAGVGGIALSSSGAGVGALNFTSTGGIGLFAATTGAGSTGVEVQAGGTSGNTVGIHARTHDTTGVAALLDGQAGGNIIIGRSHASGTNTNEFRVDGTGKGFFNGGTQTGGADFAESVAVRGEHSQYEPGDVLVVDRAAGRRLTLSRRAYSTRVAGIYSTKPGVLATTHSIDESDALAEEIPVAIVGIVPCKVTAENGPITPGDLLVTSSMSGYAMKGTNRTRMLGAVVGKALEPLREGKGVIQVLVTLQ
jgi:hypothetical protein